MNAHTKAPARRAQTTPGKAIRWNGVGYSRMLYSHGVLARMQQARLRVANA